MDTAMVSMRYRPGLRLKLNVVILPLLSATMAFFVWLDYRHEVAAVMGAHAMHAGTTASGDRARPVPAALSPSVVGRQALLIHTIHGGVTFVLLLLGVNAALSAFVLKPLTRIQDGIRQMERGQWRTAVEAAGGDEVGRLLADFGRLGLTVDALVSQSLNAERLATLALLAKRMSSEIEPEVQQLGVAAAQLQRLVDPAARDAAAGVASAAARILAASRRLDRLFDRHNHSAGRTAGVPSRVAVLLLFVLVAAAAEAAPPAQGASASVAPQGLARDAASAGAAPFFSQPRFRSGVDLVALDVCVKDRNGRFIEKLTPEDFVVLEDDSPQQVALFEPDGQVPLAVAVLVDRSSSMTGERLTRAEAAAAAFIRALRPDDLVEVLTFNDRVDRPVALGRDHDAAESAVSALTAEGSTGLFEAIAVALLDLTRARPPIDEHRRAIVVLSDGEDTSSRLAFEDVLEDARKSGAIIYAVSLRTDMKDRWLAAPYQLSQLAYDTGGRPIAVRNLETLTSIYEEIAAELRHLYRLGYVPAHVVRDGRWHAISVRVRRPDARVRTRTGYYAPRSVPVVAKGRIR